MRKQQHVLDADLEHTQPHGGHCSALQVPPPAHCVSASPLLQGGEEAGESGDARGTGPSPHYISLPGSGAMLWNALTVDEASVSPHVGTVAETLGAVSHSASPTIVIPVPPPFRAWFVFPPLLRCS